MTHLRHSPWKASTVGKHGAPRQADPQVDRKARVASPKLYRARPNSLRTAGFAQPQLPTWFEADWTLLALIQTRRARLSGEKRAPGQSTPAKTDRTSIGLMSHLQA
jgi:hypothetical protein